MDTFAAEERLTTFKQAVERVSAIAHARLPKALHGALERATAFVLHRHVWLDEDGRHAQVLAADGQTWFLANGHCTCLEAPQAQDGLCSHRLSVMLYRRASELLHAAPRPLPRGEGDAAQALAAPAALPEAPASVNVRVKVGGHECQWTLRDVDEARLAERLSALLTRYPEAVCPAKGGGQASAPASPAQPTPEGYCIIHQTQMTRQSNDRGSWWSHPKPEGGWCRGKAPRA